VVASEASFSAIRGALPSISSKAFDSPTPTPSLKGRGLNGSNITENGDVCIA